MNSILPILAIVILLSAGCGVVVWFVFRRRQAAGSEKPAEQAAVATTLTFRWRYIILPLVILLLSVILVLFFYRQLPAEVAYRFSPDGSPDGSPISRGAIILWLLVPQLLLTLLAAIITWGITKLGTLFQQAATTGIKLEGVLLLMGNIIALPQIILCFAILDIFSYNSYQIHIMPLSVFALIIMGLGAVVLGVFFIRAIQQVGRASR